MPFLSTLTGWFRRGGKSELQANMEKALRMKEEAGPQTNIPEHQTAHEGMRSANVNDDTSRGSQEGGFTPQLKRTKVARSGDAS